MKKDLNFSKEIAINLRQQGLSYSEISKKIGRPKSTLSAWLKDVELSEIHRNKLYTKQIHVLSLGTQSQRERRKREIENIVEKAKLDIPDKLSRESQLLMGAALYWAEGTKYGQFEITNSDPKMVAFMINWIQKIFGVRSTNLKARLNIHSNQQDTSIKRFWSELCNIPLKNFGKSYIKPSGKNYKKNNLYYGTIKITVPKSSNLVHKTFGWIEKVLESTKTKVELSERKWYKLKETVPINLKSNFMHP
jgi:hypothetical protein